MANRTLLIALGLVIIVIGVAQWVVISNMGAILSARVSTPDNNPLAQESIGPGETKSFSLITDPVSERIYIPVLAYPKFYVSVTITGPGLSSAADVADIEITVNANISGVEYSLQTVGASDHVVGTDPNSNAVFVYIESVDASGPSGYSLTVTNKRTDVTITIGVFGFGIKTETRNLMIGMVLVGIVVLVVGVVLKPRSSRKIRRKAFQDIEEEPTLGIGTGTASATKRSKKKKKKAKKTPKRTRRPTASTAAATCQYCGQSIPPNSFFCPHCYAELR